MDQVDQDNIRAAARSNFEQAAANRNADLAATSTPEQAKAVMDNHDAALATYLHAIRTSLEANNEAWRGLLTQAEDAADNLNEARGHAVGVTATISALGRATDSVALLVSAVT